MPSKRVFEKRSRQFNQRMIKRPMTTWGNGLVKDLEDPTHSFSQLYNAKDHGREVRGRTGSILYNNAADKSVFIPENVSLEDFFTGDLSGFVGTFIVQGFNDFTGGELFAAKKVGASYSVSLKQNSFLVYANDIYSINDEQEIEYLGNLLSRWYKEYSPHIYTNSDALPIEYSFKVEKIGYDVLLLDDSMVNFENIKNFYIVYGMKIDPDTGNPIDGTYYGQREFVTFNLDALSLRTISDKYQGIYDKCQIQFPIWGSFYYQKENKVIYLIGEELFYTDIPFSGFHKIKIINDLKPDPSESIFHLVDNDVILTNSNGVYRINFQESGLLAWKMNSKTFDDRIEPTTKYFFGFEESASSTEGDNPFGPKGFSGTGIDGEPDKTGGILI
jgi:hypothetical protein